MVLRENVLSDKHSFGLCIIVVLLFTLKFRDKDGGEKTAAATRSRFLLEPGQQGSVELLEKLDKLFIAQEDCVLLIAGIRIIATFFEIEVTGMITD